MAAAEYGLKPEVHVYKLPGKEMIHKFRADTTIKLIDMIFSRDGRFLLMIGGIPDFKISVFDLENGKMLNLSGISHEATMGECKLPCKATDYKKAKFNPQNSKEFAIMAN